MTNRVQDLSFVEEPALRNDKGLAFCTGAVCISIGCHLDIILCNKKGLQLADTHPQEDDLVKGFMISGMVSYMGAFVLVLLAMLRQTEHHRAAVFFASALAFIGVAFSLTGIIIFGEAKIDFKYNLGGLEEIYEYVMFVAATGTCLVGALALLIDGCTQD